MIEILLKFLSDITIKVIDRVASTSRATDKKLRALFDYYNSLCRVYDNLEAFTTCLKRYAANGYHSNDLYRCNIPIKKTLYAIGLLESDVNKLIQVLDFQLVHDLRGFLTGKSDVLSIWIELLQENVQEYFVDYTAGYIDGVWTKQICIPNYSVLATEIPTVFPETPYEDIAKDSWVRWHYPDDDFKQNLQYVPDLRLKFGEGEISKFAHEYIKVINLPRDEEELSKIIALTERKLGEFGNMIHRLSEILIKFAEGNPARFLKFRAP